MRVGVGLVRFGVPWPPQPPSAHAGTRSEARRMRCTLDDPRAWRKRHPGTTCPAPSHHAEVSVCTNAGSTLAEMAEDRIESQLKRLSTGPGVYIFRDGRSEVLYVGKAKSLRPRVRSYFQAGSSDTRQGIKHMA